MVRPTGTPPPPAAAARYPSEAPTTRTIAQTDPFPRSPAGTADSQGPDPAGQIDIAPLAASPGLQTVAALAATGRDIGHVPARHILRQLHDAVAHKPDGPVEVALSPEELGRVRMTLHPAEHGITVAVQAERPETLDLMRRNIEMLARDFRSLGYADVSFSFGAESGERQGGEATPPPFVAETESASPAPPIAPPTPAARGADGSLDLRM